MTKKKPRVVGQTRKATTATTIREDLDALALRVASLEARLPPQLEDGMPDAHAEAIKDGDA